ncbi:MFS transporter [Corynebacterium yudongzhengii]|uniref:MFS transporter n=1 Tax=Corynebacterium yudongzhengii TaxID=2080740 RepID=A0A2U1T802_9CORY|nr:MFS transporter [Corynebacterium yudongzhengii]AWB82809.1 MFS transporter [Corynebacterium yudongzhengii]PWC02131.1 MFS transporter [Corynebacterium yudongzhengii]
MSATELPDDRPAGLRRGEPAYKRAATAMLIAGLAVFATMYATQAMLPVLTGELNISPTTAALTVSATTGAVALFIVPTSILSEKLGRSPVLIACALGATLLGLILPLAPNAEWLIALRFVQGIIAAGVPAVAMAWLSEELHQDDLGRAMGLYVAGTTVGGLSGRLLPAGLLEVTDWRPALFALTALTFVGAIVMTILLPKQRRFRPKRISFSSEARAVLSHWRHPHLAALFSIAFVGMGVFVSVYNFIGFRMIDAFDLSPGLVGLVFLMYLSGTWSSARAGALSDKYGRGLIMSAGAVFMWCGLWLLAIPNLVLTLVGLLIFTASFFAMHSTASGRIGVIATQHRAEASSMYLMCYYLGSSVIGGIAGLVFTAFHWPGFITTAAVVLLVVVGTAIALQVQRSPGH